MLLKKLSFILLTILYFNAHSMQEQKDTEPLEQSSSAQLPHEIEDLKFYCAKKVLQENLSHETLPEDLKTYIRHFDKFNALRKYNIAPFFKKYLTGCFDHLTLDELQDILMIIEEANKIWKEKSLIMQRLILAYNKTIFCETPVAIMIHVLDSIGQNQFSEFKQKIINQKIQFYSEPQSNETEDLRIKRLNLLMSFKVLLIPYNVINHPTLTELIHLAMTNSAFAINKLSCFLNHQKGIISTFASFKKLLKIKSLDHAAEVACFILRRMEEFSLEDIEFLQYEDFCEDLNNFITLITDKDTYKSDYDLTLALIYHYLKDDARAKTIAEHYCKHNPDAACVEFHHLLNNIYQEEGDIEKAEFYSNKVSGFLNDLY